MGVREGVETEVPKARTDGEIAEVVLKVLKQAKEQERSQQASDQTAQKVDRMYRQICDSEGNCRLVTTEEFAKWKREEQERQKKKENLPGITQEIRSRMSEEEKASRDQKFAQIMAKTGGSFVDAFRYVAGDQQSRPGLKNSVLKMLQPEEVQDFLTKCIIRDGQVICAGLQSKGYRIQQKDSKGWQTLGEPEEEKKERVESHF